MTKDTAKAEAEKIIQEFIPIIDPDFGKLIKKVVWAKSTQCAIIQVKGIIEALPLHDYHSMIRTKEDWQFILTELERK